MSEPQFPPPPASPVPGFETCYRHPQTVTGVHCTRCGRPICPDCMVPAPVGYQCPECVEAARKEFKMGAARRVRTATGSMTKLLLGAIVAMYVVEVVVSRGDVVTGPNNFQLFNLGAMYPPSIADGQYWRLFTSMFLHAGIFHLLMNCWALWVFGPAVERMVGRARFLAIYFVAGFVGGAASYAFAQPEGFAPGGGMPIYAVGVGASGAIVGVFGAFLAYNWRRRHTAVARAYLQQGLVIILINAMLTLGYSAIDWKAHVGGLVGGFAAGFLTEEVEVKGLGRGAQVGVFVVVAAAGVLLIAWRTPAIKATFGL